MLRTLNPFRRFLNADGKISRAAVMLDAWSQVKAEQARYRSPEAAKRNRYRDMSRALKISWSNARIGQSNEARRIADEKREAELIAYRNQPRIAAPVTGTWSASDLLALSTDGPIRSEQYASLC